MGLREELEIRQFPPRLVEAEVVVAHTQKFLLLELSRITPIHMPLDKPLLVLEEQMEPTVNHLRLITIQVGTRQSLLAQMVVFRVFLTLLLIEVVLVELRILLAVE